MAITAALVPGVRSNFEASARSNSGFMLSDFKLQCISATVICRLKNCQHHLEVEMAGK